MECDVLVVYGRRIPNKDEAWMAATDRPKGKWLGTGHKTDMFDSTDRMVLHENKAAKSKGHKEQGTKITRATSKHGGGDRFLTTTSFRRNSASFCDQTREVSQSISQSVSRSSPSRRIHARTQLPP